MDSRAFETFGLPLYVAMAVTVIASLSLLRLNRSTMVSPDTKHRANVILGVLLLIAVALEPILTWLRYPENPEEALLLARETALPLYLCDVGSVVPACALFTRRQRLAEIGHVWGIAGTVQGFITPTLYFSWNTPESYARR